MAEAKIYRINHPRYKYVVRFRKKGFDQYNKYHLRKSDAEEDRDAFNKKLLEEGRQGMVIGPRQRRHIEDFIIACEERNLTIVQATEIIRGTKPRGGHFCEDTLLSLLELREKQGRSRRTLTGLKNHCRAFFAHCGKNKIERIETGDVIEFVFAAAVPSSQLSRFAALTNLFNHAVRLGHIDVSPAEGIDPPKKKKRGAAKIFLPEDAETFMHRIEDFRGGVLVSYFALLLFGGLRPSEAYDLTRKDIRARTIRVEGGKMEGRARRNVPINDTLKIWLEAYQELPLMPDGLNEHSPILKEARKLSPVPWVQDICRHTYASTRMALTDDEKLVGREMGTNPDTIYKYYHEALEREEAEKYELIFPSV